MGRADLPRFWTYIAAYCGWKWEKSDLELAAVPERSGRGETSQRLRRDNERGSGWREREEEPRSGWDEVTDLAVLGAKSGRIRKL